MPRWPAIREIEPDAATNTRLGSVGSTTILPTAALSLRPHCSHVAPLSMGL
jgi:hypothetical protein